jgi:hypothetical protein
MNRLSLMTPFLGFLLLSCGVNDVGSSRKGGGGLEKETPGIDGSESHLVMSHVHRSRNTPVLTSLEEIAQTLTGTLPASYRRIPDITVDDEGTANGNVITVSFIGRPNATCGLIAAPGIDGKIKNCNSVLNIRSNWNGSVNGASGEGPWKLVANNQISPLESSEIWLDTRTGLVWSDVVAAGNWCQASGNKQTQAQTQVEDGIDCAVERSGESFCANYTMLNSDIKWRLPTRNDFLQADINGLRLVLKKKSSTFWTSTLVSGIATRDQAWLYNDLKGTLSSDNMRNNHQIRCVGTPTR